MIENYPLPKVLGMKLYGFFNVLRDAFQCVNFEERHFPLPIWARLTYCTESETKECLIELSEHKLISLVQEGNIFFVKLLANDFGCVVNVKKGREEEREPKGGWGVRRDRWRERIDQLSDIDLKEREKKILKKEKEKFLIDEQNLPKIPCPYIEGKGKYKCINPSCKFGEFWAEYSTFKSSGKWRAHGSFKKLTWRCIGLASEIIDDVVTRKLKHAPWQVEEQYRPHATTFLNGRRWEDPIEEIQHGRRPANQKLPARTAHIINVRRWTKESIERDNF